MNERFYLLEIQLVDIEPPIWRRFVVPAKITLDRLHDVIQIVMGWTDSHLYEFIIGRKHYTDSPESKENGLECGRYRLGDLIKKKGRFFQYRYDFGDNWDHQLVLVEDRYFNPELKSPAVCLDGKLACPPEDVGGLMGYFEFLEAVKDPKHENHKSCIEWSNGEHDIEKFDADAINRKLDQYLRWSRDRYQDWGLESEIS